MIKSLSISGFRGVSQEVSLTLGAVTLLAGRNGLGKTTVFDAIDWCLFGPSWRLGFDPEATKNIYHPNLSPAVRMEVSLPGKTFLVERTSASAFLDGSRISDRDFVETLMTDPGGIAPYARDVERRLRRVVYLSQEDIRGLVHPDTASERTSLFQALLGVPNAAVMQSGVRRIREHFRQREQELRLHLGQLRVKRDELRASLHEATSDTVDTARVVSEAARALAVPSTLSVDEFAQRSRRELDRLSAESIQLDEAVSAIAAFRERRKADALAVNRLGHEIEQHVSEESDATAARDKAVLNLTSSREISEERRRALNIVLDLQKRLQERLSGQRRIAELTAAEADATKALGAAEELRARLHKDLERFRDLSNVALDRRRDVSVKRSELQAARDRKRTLQNREREESGASCASCFTEGCARQAPARNGVAGSATARGQGGAWPTQGSIRSSEQDGLEVRRPGGIASSSDLHASTGPDRVSIVWNVVSSARCAVGAHHTCASASRCRDRRTQ